jgi:hypothetical protein
VQEVERKVDELHISGKSQHNINIEINEPSAGLFSREEKWENWTIKIQVVSTPVDKEQLVESLRQICFYIFSEVNLGKYIGGVNKGYIPYKVRRSLQV